MPNFVNIETYFSKKSIMTNSHTKHIVERLSVLFFRVYYLFFVFFFLNFNRQLYLKKIKSNLYTFCLKYFIT